MQQQPRHNLSKQERMASRKLMEQLFAGGRRSMSAFPLRAVFMTTGRAGGEPPVQVLVSVPKRHFKRAVRRNRAKRQMREAYRLNKHILWQALQGQPGKQVAVAFLWQSDRPHASREVAASMASLLGRMAEKIGAQP